MSARPDGNESWVVQAGLAERGAGYQYATGPKKGQNKKLYLTSSGGRCPK